MNLKNLSRQIKYNNEKRDNQIDSTYNKLNCFLLNYYNAIQKVSKTDSFIQNILEFKEFSEKKFDMMFLLFIDWYEQEGSFSIDKILKNLDAEKLDERFNSFINVYSKYIEDALSEDNIEFLYEFLYRIPCKMEKDFERFGFLCVDQYRIIAKSTFEEIKPRELEKQVFKISINMKEPDSCRASIILC